MKLNASNPLKLSGNSAITFEIEQVKEVRILNSLAKRILNKIIKNKVEKQKSFIICYPDCVLLSNKKVNKLLNKN